MGEDAVGAAINDAGGGFADAGEAGDHEGVRGERAAGWVDADAGVECEGVAKDQLLVREGRVEFGYIDRGRVGAGALGGEPGRGRLREITDAERVRLDAMVDAADPCGTR